MLVRHPVSPRVGIFANGTAQLFGVDEQWPPVGRRLGFLADGGVRLGGHGGAVELFWATKSVWTPIRWTACRSVGTRRAAPSQ